MNLSVLIDVTQIESQGKTKRPQMAQMGTGVLGSMNLSVLIGIICGPD